jgi:hypothetical protein
MDQTVETEFLSECRGASLIFVPPVVVRASPLEIEKMKAIEAIKHSLDSADMICMMYVNDLSDSELMMRPHPGCNHINWQLGHLIAAEHHMINQVAAGAMPALPAGFAEKYTKETSSSDDPQKFFAKDELLATYRAQRAGTLSVLQTMTEADLDRETGVQYASTVGAMLLLQGGHWTMHAGQWVIVRRSIGKPALF